MRSQVSFIARSSLLGQSSIPSWKFEVGSLCQRENLDWVIHYIVSREGGGGRFVPKARVSADCFVRKLQ